MSKQKYIPAAGEVFHEVGICKGKPYVGAARTVANRDGYNIAKTEWTDGSNRYDARYLYPGEVCGGPGHCPLGLALNSSLFVYALARDVDAAAKEVREEYIRQAQATAAEARNIAETLLQRVIDLTA